MIAGATIDFSRMQSDLRQMYSAMIGNGFGDSGDLNRVAEIEAGHLAWEISESLGPKTKDGARKYVERDLSKFLTTKPARINLSPEQQESSAYSDFRWLYAGPSYLVGINMEDDRTDASAIEAMQFVRAGQKTAPRVNAYVPLGVRGMQHIYRLNWKWVSKSAFSGAYRYIRDSLIGELRATFASAAAKLLPSKRVPSWVEEKIAQVESKGKTHFEPLAGLAPASYLEFGSHAPGVESNPRVQEKMQGAVDRRSYVMESKIKKLLAGYAYNYNTGQVFRPRASDLTEDSE